MFVASFCFVLFRCLFAAFCCQIAFVGDSMSFISAQLLPTSSETVCCQKEKGGDKLARPDDRGVALVGLVN